MPSAARGLGRTPRNAASISPGSGCHGAEAGVMPGPGRGGNPARPHSPPNLHSQFLRTVYDDYNDEEIVLSKAEMRMINRIRKGAAGCRDFRGGGGTGVQVAPALPGPSPRIGTPARNTAAPVRPLPSTCVQ